jgi:hypothetical protein
MQQTLAATADHRACCCCCYTHRGLSRGERLVNPDEYQQLLGLGNDTHSSNTWLTYTFTWQASHVIWAINGVPILRRTTGELVTWNDMLGKPYA